MLSSAGKEFRFIKDEYTNRDSSQRNNFRKAKKDRNDLRGKACPSCGLTRSMTNLCDCNS